MGGVARYSDWESGSEVDAVSDRELLERLRDGDASAFDALYEAYRPRLYAYLLRMTRRPDVAEDLLEETWLRLIRRPPRPEATPGMSAWLFTVAHNLFVSWCRWRLLDAERVGEFARQTLRRSPAPAPLEALTSDEETRRIEVALARLPARSREALLLVGVEGMTPAEAATVCAIAPEAMRARLMRARRQLAEELGSDTSRRSER